jgi:hypothetical protein
MFKTLTHLFGRGLGLARPQGQTQQGAAPSGRIETHVVFSSPARSGSSLVTRVATALLGLRLLTSVCCVTYDVSTSNPSQDASVGLVDAVSDSPSAQLDGSIVRVTFGERPESMQKGVTADTDIVTNDAIGAEYNFGDVAGLNPDPNMLPGEQQRITLMRFNLASIPVSRKVVGATLSLYTQADTGCAVSDANQVDIFRVSEAWEEGDQLGAPGAANRTMRTRTLPWTSPGVGPGSRDSNPSTFFKPTQISAESQVDLTSLVKVWVANPSLNFGWMMRIKQQDGDGACFLSSENTSTPERRPQLEIVLE